MYVLPKVFPQNLSGFHAKILLSKGGKDVKSQPLGVSLSNLFTSLSLLSKLNNDKNYFNNGYDFYVSTH